jgi:acetyl esterase/lipase
MDEPPSPTVAPAAVVSPSSASHTAQLTSGLRLLFLFLSKIPLLTQVAILHVLQLSEPSKYLDLKSNLLVSLIRAVLTPSSPRPVSSVQRFTTRNVEIKGKIWVSSYASPPPPETDIRDSLIQVVESMRAPSAKEGNVRIPPFAHVEAEWTGYRAAAGKKEHLPKISEVAKYNEMMKECQKPTTVLYFHGGAYYLMDPASHRNTVLKLAKLTKGRCYSVRYRLAPQNPFPSALLDALVSYFTLLYPPPDAFHEAVKPEHIVFAGDRYDFLRTFISFHVVPLQLSG